MYAIYPWNVTIFFQPMRKLQVDILGLSTSPHTNGAYALILYELEGKRKLPIIIGGFEAQAIALKLENIKPPRHQDKQHRLPVAPGQPGQAIKQELREKNRVPAQP